MSLARTVRPCRVAVIAFSTLSHDTRVMRAIGTLAEMGHEVLAVGFGDKPAGVSTFVRLPVAERGWPNRIGMALRHAPAAIAPFTAEFLHGLAETNAAARRVLCELRPDIVHANDWPTLPAAQAAKAVCGSRIVYDSHEFATEEHAHRLVWRLLMRAHVAAIEAKGIAAADRVIAVSDGIARSLTSQYGLSRLPTVVRNVPAWQPRPFRPTGHPRRLLFHGILKDYRGIEAIIAALPVCPDDILTLRGDLAPGFAPLLTAAIRAAGVANRVTIEPAVPPDEVVGLANSADIGVYLGPTETRHNRFALPNKLFEYVMAGLAVLVSPGDDMVALVNRHRFGRVVPRAPDSLGRILSELSAAEVDEMKRAALVAARDLSWDMERAKLEALYAGLTAGCDRGRCATSGISPA